jgi:hypothetical protein
MSARVSPWFRRLKYLRMLYNNGVKPVGDWSRGFPPNFQNDEAGTELAKMEARWLEID